ncbi:helix-turn-helix domain-containing protein [Streptomyces sp. MC1]|uniref:IclR family transcriptional regulator n=1 Tax=Streptomyces sp. MC1 TaxID=295105 RepID=UPI0018CB4A34|nr:IclR family transcriptional regulator C-terminal domain-containing protein [Streptomyces sp. MC1]MBG7699809.1 helix-turn-helix domain-containing protein [Streptomyces sp. MC1]
MARSQAGESVLARAARVLAAFGHDSRVLTVAEIARRAALPVPTAHRLVAQLLDVGFLERTEGHGVRVGLHLWEIASLGARALDLREAAMPFLEDIHAATRQHTQLTVLDGTDVLVLEWLRAREALPGLRLHAGRRIPAHAAAAGAVLLAHAEARAQEEVLAGPLTRLSDRTPTDPSDLRSLWAHARRRGYAVCDGFVDARATGIAVPVPGRNARPVAAIGVVVPADEARPMELVPALLAAARGIGRALSTPPSPG